MTTLIVLYACFLGLGDDEFSVRESCQRTLSNPYMASLLPPYLEIQDPEVRQRVLVIKRKYAWWLYPDLVELSLYRADIEEWFWQYGFEGDSLIRSDLEIRLNADLRRTLAVFSAKYPHILGRSAHLFGIYVEGEEKTMRIQFEFYNSRGQAKRSVIGGMWGVDESAPR